MNLFKKIKLLFKRPWTEAQLAEVFFYPDKIIVLTFDLTDGPWKITDKLTILQANVSPNTLGATLKKHLDLAEYIGNYQPKNGALSAYKKAAGFKTNKETYQNARCISVHQKDQEITLTPTENLYNTGYDHRSDLAIRLPLTVSDEELGLQLSKARERSNG
ncbi:MAG TPA: hypothetical protein DIW47_04810 [Bacteroidetes bacterium]|nr:hypothetical protein [Bacteroidota bacterium]